MSKFKKIVFLSILLSLLPFSVWAEDIYGFGVAGAAWGGTSHCSGVGQQEQNTSGEALTSVANASDRKWVGTKFLATSTYEVCKILVPIQKNNSASQAITILYKIYNNSCVLCDRSDDRPGSQLGENSDKKPRDGLHTSVTDETFSFIGMKPSIISGSYYWIVACNNTTDSTNYWQWQNTDTGVIEDIKTSSDGVTWSTDSISRSQRWILWKR